MRSTLLNPVFIKERMKGDASTAQMFGEMFRNVFGWTVMRPSALNENTYDELYGLYVEDKEHLGISEYFDRVNPAALQEMTATMLESARKGYWNPTSEQRMKTAKLHAQLTNRHGAPCTEFVCGNKKLQNYICTSLDGESASEYNKKIMEAIGDNFDSGIVRQGEMSIFPGSAKRMAGRMGFIAGIFIILLIVILLCYKIFKNKEKTDEIN